eukprot:scaffold13290_cov150-Skeletonema_menzelii.AAC.5
MKWRLLPTTRKKLLRWNIIDTIRRTKSSINLRMTQEMILIITDARPTKPISVANAANTSMKLRSKRGERG